MAWYDRIVSPFVDAVKRSIQTDRKFFLNGRTTTNSYQPANLSRQYLLAYRNWVYANATVIARKVADTQFTLFKVANDGEETELFQHEVLELINRVNNSMTKSDLLTLTQLHLDLLGEAMWFVPRASDKMKPTEIFPIRPDWAEVIPGDPSKGEPMIKQYKYRTPGSADAVILNSWEVLFFKYPDPENFYRGLSPLKAAALIVDTDEGSWEWNSMFFSNHAEPSATLTTDQNLDDSQIDRILKSWESRFRGTRNAHKVTVLDSGLKFNPTQQTHKDMDFAAQQTWTRDAIMAMYQNTKISLGIVEDVNRASAETSEAVWMKHAIVPRVRRIVDTINEFLLPAYGPDLVLDVEDIVPEDKEHKLALLTQGTNVFLTVNESREELGLDPLEGGDVLYMPVMNVPTVGDGTAQPTPPVEGNRVALTATKKAKPQAKRPSHRARTVLNKNVRMKKLKAEVAKKIAPMIKDMVEKRNNPVRGNDRRARWWKHQVRTMETYRGILVASMQNVMQKQREDVITRLTAELERKQYKAATKSLLSVVFKREAWERVVGDAFQAPIEALIKQSGQDAIDFFGLDAKYEYQQAAAKQVLNLSKKLADTITKTQERKLGKALAEGIEAGENVDQLAERVQDVFKDFSETQARSIAQTESIRALNFAAVDAWKQTGIVTAKEWVTERDGSVCPYCQPLDGKTIKLDSSYFEVGDRYRGDADTALDIEFEDVKEPPLHVNCRCVVVPVIKQRGS